MKKLFAILTVLCCALYSGMAAEAEPPTEKAVNVEKCFAKIMEKYGIESSMAYNTKRNPETKLLELQILTMEFECGTDMISEILKAFYADEKIAYQLSHILPGQFEQINISAAGNIPAYIDVRTSPDQEFIMLNTKNAENPKLRDCYAIVWQKDENKQNIIKGKLFNVTSTRPDLLPRTTVYIPGGTRSATGSAPRSDQRSKYITNRSQLSVTNYNKVKKYKMAQFTIEGTVDEAISDSCYNIYIADSHSEITDDNLVECVPVVNKKFRYSVDIDKIKAGRLRCIFPGRTLASMWVDIFFIPGMTLKLTVHDGYYDIENKEIYDAVINDVEKTEAKMARTQEETTHYNEILEKKMEAYRKMIGEIDRQLGNLRIANSDVYERRSINKRVKALHKEAMEITIKMNQLIEEYSKYRRR